MLLAKQPVFKKPGDSVNASADRVTQYITPTHHTCMVAVQGLLQYPLITFTHQKELHKVNVKQYK